MFSGLESPTHLVLLLLIVLLLFGAKRLPEMGRSLGRSIKEFKEGLDDKEVSEKQHPEAMQEVEEKADAGKVGKTEGATTHTKGVE